MLTADRDGTRGVLWPHDRLSAYATLIVSFLLALGKGAPTRGRRPFSNPQLMLSSKSKRSPQASIASRRLLHIRTNDRPNNDRDRACGRGSNYCSKARGHVHDHHVHDHMSMTTVTMPAMSMPAMSMTTMALACDRSGREHHGGGKGDRETKFSKHFVFS